MANGSNTLRLSGINSGFDTESIVNALTANTKLKITKQERKLLTLQNTQTAYRDIISNIQSLQKKYFDVLNQSTYLKGSSLFSKYKAETSMNGESKNMAGVTISTSYDSVGADYSVKVNNVAKQASVQSVSLSDSAKIDLSAYSDSSATYGFTVNVGGEEKSVTFSGSADAETVRNNINDALCEAYGNSNLSASDENIHEGLVYVDAAGKFAAANKKSVTVSGITALETTSTLDMTNLATGKTTLKIQVGNQSVNVSIDSIKSDYFAETVDENGEFLENATSAMKKLYTQVKDDLIESYAYEDYQAWKESDGYEAEKAQLFETAFEKAEEENYNKRLDTFLQKKHNAAETDLSFDEWKAANFTEAKGNALYEEFSKEYYDQYDAEGKLVSTGWQLDKEMWEKATYNEYTAYKENLYVADENMDTSTEAIVKHFNYSNAINAISSVSLKDGTKLEVEELDGALKITAVNAKGEGVNVGITSAAGSANSMGTATATTSTNQISSATTLSEIGLTANEKGEYTFTINGEKFSFKGDVTIKDMMKTVNASDAGVNMTYSSLKNQFTITSDNYGVDEQITFEDGAEGLLGALGFNGGAVFTAGENLEVEINGEVIQAAHNAVTVDGTTFKFTDAAEGSEFDVKTTRDHSEAIEAVKSFVEDYNALIDKVYGYLDEKPETDYYFLTDSDIEDMGLTEKQQEKWEEKAKKGLLYNDSTVSSIMSDLRSALFGGVTAPDGSTVALYTMGITTSTDWSEHGKLTLNEAELTAAFENYADEIGELFSNKTSGIMVKAAEALEKGVNATGTEGTLVEKAGIEKNASALDNDIYNQMKRIKTLISSLQQKYDNQQERYWKIYSNMETQLSNLNSQTSYITNMLGS